MNWQGDNNEQYVKVTPYLLHVKRLDENTWWWGVFNSKEAVFLGTEDSLEHAKHMAEEQYKISKKLEVVK